MPSPATRLINLIMLLQRQPNQQAADLAQELGVSVRTLHRYIARLEEMGIPVYSERGPEGGFSLVRGYQMPPLVLTPEEAVAVYLGAGMTAELWGPLYEGAARGALAKLDNLLPDEQLQEAAWARRSLVASGLQRAGFSALAPTLQQLRQAVRQQRRVFIRYQSSGQSGLSERELDPYALAYQWGWWYVIGYCHLRQEVRLFRLDRIQSLELRPQVFEPPLDFDARAYLKGIFGEPPQVQARLKFAPRAADVAYSDRAAWSALESQPDGSVLVDYAAPDLYWAASTALAYGPSVEVLAPAELRALVAEWAQAVADRYAAQPDRTGAA